MTTDLKHHGVLGMRWGVRRYRGPDGRVVPGKYMSPARAAQLRKEGGSTPTVSTATNQMTTDELKKAVERLNLEKQFKQLSENEISPGRKFVKSVLADSGKRAATSLTTKYMIRGGDAAIQALIKSMSR